MPAARRFAFTAAITSVSLLILGFGVPSFALEPVHKAKASTFADPADVAGYNKCIDKGHSPKYCRLHGGDDGIGKWGADTKSTSKAMCALYPKTLRSKWGKVDKAEGKKIEVSYKGRKVTCEIQDIMGGSNNGATLDLNPGAVKALSLTPGFLMDGFSWRWVS